MIATGVNHAHRHPFRPGQVVELPGLAHQVGVGSGGGCQALRGRGGQRRRGGVAGRERVGRRVGRGFGFGGGAAGRPGAGDGARLVGGRGAVHDGGVDRVG